MTLDAAYKTLNLTHPTTEEAVSRAFRQLAMKHHPDKETGAEDKFKEILEAKERVLHDIGVGKNAKAHLNNIKQDLKDLEDLMEQYEAQNREINRKTRIIMWLFTGAALFTIVFLAFEFIAKTYDWTFFLNYIIKPIDFVIFSGLAPLISMAMLMSLAFHKKKWWKKIMSYVEKFAINILNRF